MAKRQRIVLIDWVDTGVVSGWHQPEDGGESIAHCQTVGFFIKEDDEGITLSLSKSDQGLIMEKITIPKGCIKSIRELRVK